MLATAWGVFVAGAVIWFWFEGYGDDFRRQRWLSRNLPHVRSALDTLHSVSTTTAFFLGGISADIANDLLNPKDESHLKRLVSDALERLKQESEMNAFIEPKAVSSLLRLHITHVERASRENLGLLSPQFADLYHAIQRYLTECRFASDFPYHSDTKDFFPLLLHNAVTSAIALSAKSAELYFEAGSVPEHNTKFSSSALVNNQTKEDGPSD